MSSYIFPSCIPGNSQPWTKVPQSKVEGKKDRLTLFYLLLDSSLLENKISESRALFVNLHHLVPTHYLIQGLDTFQCLLKLISE